MTVMAETLPRHLLLATDLSARCDRAQDRARDLARAWKAKLTVVHALDVINMTGTPSAPIAAARRRASDCLQREFKDVDDVAWEIDIREGEPANVVLDVARERNCDMIVTGIAGNDALGHMLVGGTTASVVRKAGLPVLVVKKRARHAYRRLVVASDLSDASAGALQMGAQLFPLSLVTLFHAFDTPFRGFLDDKQAYEHGRAGLAREDAKAFVASHLPNANLDIHLAHGNLTALLAEFVVKEDVDLLLAGTYGRTGFLGALIGSAAEALLEEVECDVMIIPGKGARSDG
ncbi:universal stress protein [Shinella sp.]|uniref:universal stress protein n=1 Tax=Shinella sp. TaxID=1870904 RepID=UPI003F72644A